MKNTIYTLILLIVPHLANADLLVERELFNARSGENYICKIHSDMKTELVNDGISLGKFTTEFSASEDNFKKWLKELKAQAIDNKFIFESNTVNNYTIRGAKRYSLYNGNTKLSFYTLQPATKSSMRGKKKATSIAKGSVETKVKNDNSNVNRLRGQTDLACKRAMARL